MKSPNRAAKAIVCLLSAILVTSVTAGCLGVKEGKSADPTFVPKMVIEIDKGAAEEYQNDADTGHNLWQLDARQVAFKYLGGILLPGGGGPQITVPIESFTLIKENGTNAVYAIEHNAPPWSRTYLTKPSKQDDEGIWMVSGYDPK